MAHRTISFTDLIKFLIHIHDNNPIDDELIDYSLQLQNTKATVEKLSLSITALFLIT